MQEIIDSVVWVTTGGNFWVWSSTIFIFGTFLGWRQNNGMNGFKRSFIILFPLFLVYFFSSANRIYEYSLDYGLGPQSFNNLVSISIITFLYIGGLFIGHNIKEKAIEQAVSEAGISKHEQKNMILKIKERI
jgi:hypothetical protein